MWDTGKIQDEITDHLKFIDVALIQATKDGDSEAALQLLTAKSIALVALSNTKRV